MDRFNQHTHGYYPWRSQYTGEYDCPYGSALATRQTSSSGRPKSPRIQVVLPEDLLERLAALAEADSRTVSNMARVLIQQGLDHQDAGAPAPQQQPKETLRQQLERQQQDPKRLRGRPRRIRLKG
jgi:hypothetical protein